MSKLDSLAHAALLSDEIENGGSRTGRGEEELEEVSCVASSGGHQHFTMSLQRVCEMCKTSHDGSYGFFFNLCVRVGACARVLVQLYVCLLVECLAHPKPTYARARPWRLLSCCRSTCQRRVFVYIHTLMHTYILYTQELGASAQNHAATRRTHSMWHSNGAPTLRS